MLSKKRIIKVESCAKAVDQLRERFDEAATPSAAQGRRCDLPGEHADKCKT